MPSPNAGSAAKRAATIATLLSVLGVGAGFALASSGPPSPAITSHPAMPTASTSASFSFTDSQAGVSYLCSLDGRAFAACTSTKSYSGLAAGTHTFRVEARSKSETGDAASYSWTVDLSPPATAISAPVGGGSYNAAGWSGGCRTGDGVCGTASDPSAVGSVAVSIRQNATGKYWSGSAYTLSTETYQTATLSHATVIGADWFYALSLPSEAGQYTLHVRASDALGNTTPSGAPVTSLFTIDTVSPPVPSLTATPASLTNKVMASFSFADGETGVGYICRVDAGAYSACTSPSTYRKLVAGTHTFYVEAQDAAGNTSSASVYSWQIDTTPPPQPVLTAHPSNPSTSTTATFSFTDAKPGSSFQCKLDSSTWTPCVSSVTYANLTIGRHKFDVRAVDPAGNISSPAGADWKIAQSTGMAFTVSGSAVGYLYPGGAPQPIGLKITNPNTASIYITGITAALQTTSLPAGCDASGFQLGQPNISVTQTVLIPANGSVTLPAQGASAPSVQMLDTHTNQNTCEGATLNFTYTGSAHS